MDIETLIERVQYDAADWVGDPHSKKDLLEASDIITELQAENLELKAKNFRLWEINNAYDKSFDEAEAGLLELQSDLERVKADRNRWKQCAEALNKRVDKLQSENAWLWKKLRKGSNT